MRDTREGQDALGGAPCISSTLRTRAGLGQAVCDPAMSDGGQNHTVSASHCHVPRNLSCNSS